MNDAMKIYELYTESKAADEQSQMHVDSNGTKMWLNQNMRFHRVHGPAIERVNGDKEWYLNGVWHRDDAPAIEHANGYTEWRVHGKRHREGAPAVESADGYKEWWLNGKRHREDAPAIEYDNGDKEWWLHGKRHREDGPAFEYAGGYREWYLNGVQYKNAEAWAQAVLKMHNKPHDAEAVQKFVRMILTKDDLI